MTVEIARRAGSYTVEDVLELYVDDPRVELLEGTLIVSPAPRGRHQLVADELRLVLHTVAPAGVRAVSTMNVRLGRDDQTLFIPDVVVTTADLAADPLLLDPADVLAVVEVVSPSSRSHDRLVKPDRYAAAGIGCYWRVELDPFPGQDGTVLPVVLVHELVDGVYRESTRLVAGQLATTELPFPVQLDPADLLR